MADINDLNELNLEELEAINGGAITPQQFEEWATVKIEVYNELLAEFRAGVEDWKTAIENVIAKLNIDPAYIALAKLLAQEAWKKFMASIQ